MVVVFYFKLHSLPEQIAHKGQKIQFEIVAILGLISLFTHNHFFWIAGLLLAFIPIPDFSTPLERMAESLAKMAGWRRTPPGLEVGIPAADTPRSVSPVAVGDFDGQRSTPCCSGSGTFGSWWRAHGTDVRSSARGG